jgi:hypothetical protein
MEIIHKEELVKVKVCKENENEARRDSNAVT